jgi:hypothetical protein
MKVARQEVVKWVFGEGYAEQRTMEFAVSPESHLNGAHIRIEGGMWVPVDMFLAMADEVRKFHQLDEKNDPKAH